MNTKQIYYLKKFAQAERTAKKAVETTVSHRSLSEFGAALGKQDHILYGRGSVVKNANMRKRATSWGSGTDFAADLLTPPGVADVGALMGLVGSPGTPGKDINPLVIVPTVGSGRMVQRRRAIDRQRSKGKRDKSAKVHEMAGGIVNSLLFGLGGAGLGAVAAAVAHHQKKKEGEKLTPDELMALYGGGAITGNMAGLLTGYLVNKGGKLAGLISGGSPKEREEYLNGNNMWKNYLIPGYAGYQSGSGSVDAMENT